MEKKDVRICQIVTVSIDSETHYKVERINEGKVYLLNIKTGQHLVANIAELNLEFNS